MSWLCPTCDRAHAEQFEEPTRCEACEVREHLADALADVEILERRCIALAAERDRLAFDRALLEQRVSDLKAERAQFVAELEGLRDMPPAFEQAVAEYVAFLQREAGLITDEQFTASLGECHSPAARKAEHGEE